jgi:hypothetical protein
MLSVTYKPFMLSVIMLNVVMLSVVATIQRSIGTCLLSLYVYAMISMSSS